MALGDWPAPLDPVRDAYELSKHLGLQLGVRHRRLPTSLKRRLSNIPVFWETR